MLAVVVAGLAVAFWLPTRNDSASATENGYGGSWSQYRDWRRFWGGQQDRSPQYPSGGWGSPFPTRMPSESPAPSETPSESPSENPSENPSESPSETPTSAAPTSEAPTSAPPTSTPSATAPTKTKWAEFTDYTAGQIVTFKGKDYQVLEDHTSLPGWEPPLLPNLFKLLS